MTKAETIEIQKELFQEGGKLGKYQNLILGEKSIVKLIKFEIIVGLSSWIPGALGLLLRSKLYPKLLGYVGRNVTFGQNVVLRHPGKIFIGDNVVVDDHCVLDAKGQDNRGIFIGDGVFIGRNTILNCKNGDIILENNVNISANCMIFSASQVRIGSDELVAAYCYLVGGTHQFEDPSIPVLHQERFSQGISLGSGGWIGAHVTIFDGVHIGEHVVIGAGSVVNKGIPDYAIAAGIPAKVIQKRIVKKDVRKKKNITVAVINYNGKNVLKQTFDSIFMQDYAHIDEVLLMDNNSSDDSVAFIRKKYPKVRVIEMGENRGPNPARNQAIKTSGSGLILLMDNDIILSEDVITKLEKALYQYPEAGIAGGQIRYHQQPDKIQYNGANIHFAGGAILNRLELEKPMKVGALPAGAILVDREKATEIGLFDEDFFYGWADGDFTFRMTLAGYSCLNVSQARVYHNKEKKGTPWVKYQIRNRWWFILKTYHARTLFFTLPAIFLYQLAMFGFCLLKGQMGGFLKGSFAVIPSLPEVLRKRREVMRYKKVKDKQVLFGQNIDLMGDTAGSKVIDLATRGFNLIFVVYWMLVKWFIK